MMLLYIINAIHIVVHVFEEKKDGAYYYAFVCGYRSRRHCVDLLFVAFSDFSVSR